MIRPSRYPPEYEVVPHAIFWRPLPYFATSIREDEDGLDIFRAASFIIDNSINFDFRHYRGHPDYTVTVYLPFDVEALSEILKIIGLILTEMALPEYVVAWRRGWDFEFGSLQRRDEDRLREAEARIIALKIAAKCPNHTATTEYIKQQIPNYFQLSSHDLVSSPTRKGEALWQQIVGNVISHKDTSIGPFRMGFAVRTENGLSVTERGLAYLNKMGFVV
jgi:hypothetical protein